MTEPTARNRLGEAASPYLQQHADNPVNWQPWDEAALAAAREGDCPIFLSVGYSACHWCHVMEEESFQEPEIAALLNEEFVPIKVDREQRPDLDRVYQTVCQLVTGRGGWPLSAWLTPAGEPFYVGTYFPPQAKRGQPGFADLLENIAESWSDPEQREEMENRAGQWTAAARDELETVPDQSHEPGSDLLGEVAGAAVRGADREHGGWGRGPKFPHPGRIHLLLRADAVAGTDGARDVATETLDAMANGGMYDQVGGGFHRYATDRDWTVPHFEKMLYDNAELTRAYLAGALATGTERYERVARETLAFVDRELGHPDGGFYSTLDARSEPPGGGEHEEGAFYVWTPEDVADVLDEDRAALACDRYGITSGGNFEGTTVPTLAATVDELAADRDAEPETVAETLEAARDAMRTAREKRPRPRRDEKVLAGWNGLAISAFAEGGLVLDERFLDRATDALAFVREHCWEPDRKRLARQFMDGDVEGEGYLEDYAFLARGALECYQVGGEIEHLAFALELAEAIVEAFYDADAETLYFTPTDGESLVARPQERRDQSTPSSIGVACEALAALDHVRDGDRFRDVATATVETNGTHLRSSPLEHATLALVADRLERGFLELTLVADERPAAWRAALSETYLPDRLLAPRPADESTFAAWLDRLGLEAAPPIWRERGPVDGQPTVYACREFTCSPPKHDVADALAWADRGSGA